MGVYLWYEMSVFHTQNSHLPNNQTVMKIKDFYDAIELLTKHHSNEIIINKCTSGGQVPDFTEPTLHVVNCVPAVVSKLEKAGFMLCMDHGFLTVNKYL